MRAAATIAALILGCTSAAAAAPSGGFDEAAFRSRVKVDPSLPAELRARATSAIDRLLKAPSLRVRAQTLADAGHNVFITTCAAKELSRDHALPYGGGIAGRAGYADGEVKAAFHDARFPDFRICWDERSARPIPGRSGDRTESVIAHELFGHAATNVMRVKSLIPAGAMRYRSEDELNAYMVQAVAMRELGYPYDHPFSGANPAALSTYEQTVVFTKPGYVHLLTAKEAADPLNAYKKRAPHWTESCRKELPESCAAAELLAALIAGLRTKSARAAFERYMSLPHAAAFHAELRKESETLRRKLATLGTGREHPGMFTYDPREDEIQFGAPILPEEIPAAR